MISSADIFSDSRKLIRQAYEDAENLRAELSAFEDEVKCTRVIEPDGDTGNYLHKIRFDRQLPDRAQTLARNAIDNLRAALEMAVYASSAAISPGRIRPGRRSQTKFPVGNSAVGLEADIERNCADVPDEIKSIFRALQPYPRQQDGTGNDVLWAMNEIRASQEHRILIPFAVKHGSVTISNMAIIGGSVGLDFTATFWDEAKNEITYLRTGYPAAQGDIQIEVFVTFSEPEVVKHTPAMQALNAMCWQTRRALHAIGIQTVRTLRTRPA